MWRSRRFKAATSRTAELHGKRRLALRHFFIEYRLRLCAKPQAMNMFSPCSPQTQLLLAFHKLIRISFKGTPGRGTPENILLNLLGEGEVFVSDPSGGMGHE